MRADRVLVLGGVAVVLGIALLSGCAPRVHAPTGWLPSAEDASRDPYGGWIRLQVVPGTVGAVEVEVELEDIGSWEFHGDDRSPEQVTVVQGEFLGVGADSVFVLAGNDSIRAVAYRNIVRAEVAFFAPGTGEIQGWALMGGLTTLSHGVFLGLTMPMWAVGGSGAATSHAKRAIRTLGDETWEELRAYARFPQGPPPGLRDLRLHMRPPPAEPPPRNE